MPDFSAYDSGYSAVSLYYLNSGTRKNSPFLLLRYAYSLYFIPVLVKNVS
jgi:hypothetical protein